MARRKKKGLLSLICAILFLFFGMCFVEYNGGIENTASSIPANKADFKEKDYVNLHCKTGQIEYMLSDKTRVDCLTSEYAVEFDWAQKWAESIGQALYYSKMTGKKPAVAIILKTPSDEKYIERIHTAMSDLKIYKIKAYEDTSEPAL